MSIVQTAIDQNKDLSGFVHSIILKKVLFFPSANICKKWLMLRLLKPYIQGPLVQKLNEKKPASFYNLPLHFSYLK